MENRGGPEQRAGITLVIKTPSQAHGDQRVGGVDLDWTVGDLKSHLSAVYPDNPVSYQTERSVERRNGRGSGWCLIDVCDQERTPCPPPCVVRVAPHGWWGATEWISGFISCVLLLFTISCYIKSVT